MQVISPDVHGVLDYVTGAALLAAPRLFGYARARGQAAKSAELFGSLILGQSVMTAYRYGLLKVLPFKMHLALDWAMGPFLALSPFLFGFTGGRKKASWLTHVIAGTWVLATTAMTRPTHVPYEDEEDLEAAVREQPDGWRDVDWEPAYGRRMPAGAGTD
jgi:hypothetical protein